MYQLGATQQASTANLPPFFQKAKSTQGVNSTIYHSFSSCKPLAASQNTSPTRTSNPIYDPHGMINFSKWGVTGFWYLKTSSKI